MHYFEVAPNQIIRIDKDVFTYSSEEDFSVGNIVIIEVGKKEMTGVIIRKVEKPAFPTKKILSLIEINPLPKELVQLSRWLADYYNTPLSLVLQTMLPSGIRKKRQIKEHTRQISSRKRTNIVFNKEQSDVLSKLSRVEPGTFLLEGVTGSGKTEIYIELAKQSIKLGRSVVVLVPEISLTPQMLAEFSHHFEDIMVVHSTITESQRHLLWLDALNSTKPRLVIGARSAIFTPLKDIGVIIVDEAHEPSFKQEQSPRYSALRAATILGRYHKSKVIFGSATPSVIDRYLAEKSGNPILRLTKPARKDVSAPIITLVDMTKKDYLSNTRFFSKQLINELRATISSGGQALIYHNRRGSASTTLCDNCGWTAICPNCYIPLTLHADLYKNICHICNYQDKVPTSCPDCNNVNIIHKGVGTKLIETELTKIFPKVRIARFDADNGTSETLGERYEDLYNAKIDIAIGTQIVAKGLDLPHLKMVGVIQADSGLALPDFSSSERTFQLLTQVIGRVGRNENSTKAVIQSYQVNHPSVVFGLSQDYESFYQYALKQRKDGLFPPYTYLLKLVCSYKSESAAIKSSNALQDILSKNINKNVRILGPTPAFYERRNDSYRWQLILKSPKRQYLMEALKFVPTANWQSELDPTSLL